MQLARAYSRLAKCIESLASIPVLPFDEECIDRVEAFRESKIPVRTMDLRVAATVLEFDGVLVARNIRDFQHIRQLKTEDWSV